MLKHGRFSIFSLVPLLAAAAQAQTAAPPQLTLAQALDQALKNNVQTRLAQERTTESRAQRGVALSPLLPNVSGAAYQASLTANLAAEGLTSAVFPGVPAFIGPFRVFDARLRMQASLFNLASIRGYQAARYGVQLAERQRQLIEEQVAAATSMAYIEVLEAGQSVEAAQANVELARSLLDLAVNQRKAGIATGLDVVRADTRLAGQQVRLAQVKTNLDTARLNLFRLIGSPLGAPTLPADAMRFDPQPLPDTSAAIARALATRKPSGRPRWADGRPRFRPSAIMARAASSPTWWTCPRAASASGSTSRFSTADAPGRKCRPPRAASARPSCSCQTCGKPSKRTCGRP
jgi:outer membrane protein TolC